MTCLLKLIPRYPKGGGNSFKKSPNLEVFIKNSALGLYFAQLFTNALISYFLKMIISFISFDS
jgi:hypothetical protein